MVTSVSPLHLRIAICMSVVISIRVKVTCCIIEFERQSSMANVLALCSLYVLYIHTVGIDTIFYQLHTAQMLPHSIVN